MFADRSDAGRVLAGRLRHLRGGQLVVLGLARGGVPVADEVAADLGAPLDVIVVRKLGVPAEPELAMGAIGEGGVRVLDDATLRALEVSRAQVDAVEARERAELDRRIRWYRGGGAPRSLAGRTAVVVDDGIATGATARAACRVARARGAQRVVLATPVASPGWAARLRGDADELVCVEEPSPFVAVGRSYRHFPPTGDEEVVARLERAARRAESPSGRPSASKRQASGPTAGKE